MNHEPASSCLARPAAGRLAFQGCRWASRDHGVPALWRRTSPCAYTGPVKSWMKRILMELLVGATLGFVLWCLIGKGMTSMMFGSLGGSFTCKADVERALDQFLAMQLYAAAGGAVLVTVGTFLVRRALDKSKREKPVAPQG
jgi:hypothetical protein